LFASSETILVGGTLILGPGAQYVPVLQSAPPETLTYVVASYSAASGSFSFVGDPVANFTASCVELGKPTLSQTPTSISITIPVSSPCSGNLSSAAIAGIVIGSLVFALAIVAAILGVYRRRVYVQQQAVKRRTILEQEQRERDMKRRTVEMQAYECTDAFGVTAPADNLHHPSFEPINDVSRPYNTGVPL
jgi:C4-dicarboxylate-specific signal transduction histidine kinase